MGIKLLDEQTIDTTGSQDTVYYDNIIMAGKGNTVHAYGTWDGATVTLEFLAEDGTTWIACGENTTFTEDGAGNLYFTPPVYLRGSLSSAGASTSLSLVLA